MAFTGLVNEKVKTINYQIQKGVRRLRTKVQTGKSTAVNTRELMEREAERVEG